jgi:hypothetical protein
LSNLKKILLYCRASLTDGTLGSAGGKQVTAEMHGTESYYFGLGDYAAGALTGVLTALVVRGVIGPHWDMVLAMLVGMALGMIVHLLLGLLLTPLLGAFEVMIPGAMIGMYGGMLFGMRDSMQYADISLRTALAVGALFGLLVVFGVHWWNRQLRGEAFVAPKQDFSKLF